MNALGGNSYWKNRLNSYKSFLVQNNIRLVRISTDSYSNGRIYNATTGKLLVYAKYLCLDCSKALNLQCYIVDLTMPCDVMNPVFIFTIILFSLCASYEWDNKYNPPSYVVSTYTNSCNNGFYTNLPANTLVKSITYDMNSYF